MTNDMFAFPEPVFQRLKVENKKGPKLFRRFGEVRIIEPNGQSKVLSAGGYERAYPETHKGKKK